MKKSEALSGAITFIVLTAIAITVSRFFFLNGDNIGGWFLAIGSAVFGFPACAFTYLWANPGEYVEEPGNEPIAAREAEAEPDDKHWMHRPEKLFAAYQLFK